VIVSLLVAMDERGGIGKENRLPWRLSADMQRFKALTWGHHLLMGRKTFQSIGRVLAGRTAIVITRKPGDLPPGCHAPDCLVALSLQFALDLAAERGEDEAFIIGGGEIFAQALELADRIYLTQVHAEVQADVFFPTLDWEKWETQEVSYQPADEKNEFPFTFKILHKKQQPP
jgi:dihydrofolate reductase